MKTRLLLVLAMSLISFPAIAQEITGWDRISFGMSKDQVTAAFPGPPWRHSARDDRYLVLVRPRMEGVDAVGSGFTYDDRCYGICVALNNSDLRAVRREIYEKYRLPASSYSTHAGSKAYCFYNGARRIVVFRLVREDAQNRSWLELREEEKERDIVIVPGFSLRKRERVQEEHAVYEGEQGALERACRMFQRTLEAVEGDGREQERLAQDTYERGEVCVVYFDNALYEAAERARREWDEKHRDRGKDRDRDKDRNSAWAGVRKISEREVPKAVMDAVRDEVPGARFMSGIISEDRGRVSYRLNVQARDGSVFYLRATPAGEITYLVAGFQVEDIVPADRMPQRITDRLREIRPDARVLEVEMGRHHDRLVYEITIANGDRVEEIYITESGEVLKREEKRHEHDHHHGNHSHFSITF